MKRLKNKYAHKLAWWLRRWANKLEPQVIAPRIDAPTMINSREYKLNTLRVRVDDRPFEGIDFHDLALIKAKRQIGQAVEKLIEEEIYKGYANAANKGFTVLQLLILSPADHVYRRKI